MECLTGNKDEKQLLESLKNGSYDAYTCLYNKWLHLLYRFVYSFVKSRSITDEIVQEAFVKIWTNHAQLETEKSFKSYLFTISYHMILKEFRYRVNHAQMDNYIDFVDDIVHSESLDIYKMDFDYFMSELNKSKLLLPPRQREIFEMNKEENLSVKEIAEKLQLNEQTVRNQLSISLKTIRKELAHFSLFLFLYL